MKMPEIPTEHYIGLGKVAVAAAKLEVMVGQVAAAGLDPEESTRFGELAGVSGRAMRKLDELCKRWPDEVELRLLHSDARKVLDERNQYVHAIVRLDFAPADGTPAPAWVLHQPRDGGDIPMPSLVEMEDLAARMLAVSERTIRLGYVAFERRKEEQTNPGADSVRTEHA